MLKPSFPQAFFESYSDCQKCFALGSHFFRGKFPMRALHIFGAAFGLPDPSPFVVKADLLMKMSGLDYKITAGADVRKGPKQKVPYITDNDKNIRDSTLIRYWRQLVRGFYRQVQFAS
jgi:hypothetical protein